MRQRLKAAMALLRRALAGDPDIDYTEGSIGRATVEPGVVASGIESLRIMGYGFIFLAVGLITIQAFNGAGDTMTPTWINIFCFWLIQLPLAWTLSRWVGLGPSGIYLRYRLEVRLEITYPRIQLDGLAIVLFTGLGQSKAVRVAAD